MNNRFIASLLALAALSLPCAVADAQEAPSVTTQCAQAYEQGQVQRKSGGLLQARSALQQCSQDECPEFIRKDCLGWFAEIQDDVPSLVFAAKSHGRDLSDVQVSLGERVLASRIDGQVLELDPGEYDLHFESPGMQSQTQHLVLVTGERHRLVQVELVPLSTTADDAGLPAPPKRSRSRSLLLPGVLMGVGGLGVGAFAGLGAWGHSSESKLELSCSPHCRSGQVADVKTKYLLADVSLGVGVVALALGAYFYLSQDSGDVPNVGVTASSRTATLTYGGAF